SGRPQPVPTGFVFERTATAASFGKARPAAGPKFRALVPALAAHVAQIAGRLHLRQAQFVAGAPQQRAMPVRIQRPGGNPRWKPLSTALPEQPPGKIVLVLGSLLQRPVGPAGQERLADEFEIPFLPVSFPKYLPRMGNLEERMHRTDRIGFSPP